MNLSKRISKSILPPLIAVSISVFGFIACDELEPVNPADLAYKLDPPTLLSVEDLTDTQIEITWKNNEEHSKEFVISRKSGSGSYSAIGTVDKDIVTFTDSACVLGLEYSYVVQSKVGSNVSANSNSLSKATTFQEPTNLNVIVISDESVRLTWADNTGYESGFKIERDAGSGFTEIGTVSSDVTEYTDSGLIFGQSYEYRVAAYTPVNTSAWAIITAITEFPAPSDLSTSSVSDSELLLTWTDNTGYETGFKIERDTGSGFTEVGTVSANVAEYTDSGLTFGQSYDYRVAAFTTLNTSDWATVAATTEFPAPSDLTASPLSDSELRLTWSDNTGYELGFRVERDAGSGFDEIGVIVADVTEFVDTDLIYGQSYEYRVAAFTAVNISGWVIVTKVMEIPGPSALTAISVSDSTIQLTWSDNASFEAGFIIERDDGNGFNEIGTVGSDIQVYTDIDLNFGQSYDYRVAAFTILNTSVYSSIATIVACLNCVIDIDGNVYKTVQIGDQVWMAENLRVTRYRNGDLVPLLTENNDWTSASFGAMCYYANDVGYASTYGALYNWHSVAEGGNLAPEGWHVPSDSDWLQLEQELGMSPSQAETFGLRGTDQGSQLAGDVTLWSNGALVNNMAFGISGFDALPAGSRNNDTGQYMEMGNYTLFWSSASGYESGKGVARALGYNISGIYRGIYWKKLGYSVRCVRD